ncbi:MAG: hypothetical protein M3O23_04315 [Actinomycetota bacterium]|nr:hypothetical protein [Actinomycetota bacterium]
MSTIWTPSGERPVPKDSPAAPSEPGPPPAGGGDPAEQQAMDEMAAQMEAMQQQLLRTPAVVVVANHCIAFYELAVLHLSQDPPNVDDARIAIDAMAGVVEGLGARLGQNERPLKDALAQLQLAFIEARSMAAGGRPTSEAP